MKIRSTEYKGIPFLMYAIVVCYMNIKILNQELNTVYTEVAKINSTDIDTITWEINNFFKAYRKNYDVENLTDIFKYIDTTKKFKC